jgi:hypothetical protein
MAPFRYAFTAPNGPRVPLPTTRISRVHCPASAPSHGPRPPRPTACVSRVQRRASAPSYGPRPPPPTACVSRVQRRASNGARSPRLGSYSPRLIARVGCARWRVVVMLNRARLPRSTALVRLARQSLFAVRQLGMTSSYVPALRTCRMISSSLKGSRWPCSHVVVQ